MSADDSELPPYPPALCEYAAEVTAERLERMLSHIDGVRKADEIEPVHQMRVWSRRSRAALEIFDVCFVGREFTEVEREVKAATDALSEARDLDVMIENLQSRGAKLPETQRSGIDSFIARLHAQRDERQKSVADAVTELERHHLAQRFRELAHRAAAGLTATAGGNGHISRKARTNGRKRGRSG